jgi:hypothetical protein
MSLQYSFLAGFIHPQNKQTNKQKSSHPKVPNAMDNSVSTGHLVLVAKRVAT